LQAIWQLDETHVSDPFATVAQAWPQLPQLALSSV